jgi:hypothetical protein
LLMLGGCGDGKGKYEVTPQVAHAALS